MAACSSSQQDEGEVHLGRLELADGGNVPDEIIKESEVKAKRAAGVEWFWPVGGCLVAALEEGAKEASDIWRHGGWVSKDLVPGAEEEGYGQRQVGASLCRELIDWSHRRSQI